MMLCFFEEFPNKTAYQETRFMAENGDIEEPPSLHREAGLASLTMTPEIIRNISTLL